MDVFDFFSGIGGFSLAAEWMGWEVVSQCEIDPYCQKILKKHWPDVYLHNDIKTYNIETYKMAKGASTEPSIFTGGFPCQPFSTAGKRKGMADNRNLWPDYHRIIQECKPTYIVGENVPGLLTMEDGKVFDRICLDLESEGYQVESYLIPACSIEAWHRRERTWIIGYLSQRSDSHSSRTDPDDIGSHREEEYQYGEAERWCSELQHKQEREPGSVGEDVPYPTSKGLQESQESEIQFSVPNAERDSLQFPRRKDQWETEPAVGRVVDELPNRVDRIKGLGNAVVPHLVYELFKAIQAHHITQMYLHGSTP